MEEFGLRFRFQIEGKAELDRAIDDGESRAKKFASAFGAAMKQGGADLAKLGVSAANTLKQISGLQFGIAAQARGVLDFRDAVNRLAIAGDLADDKLDGLRNQILDVAVASGQMKENVTEALGAFVAKTGDIATARKNLELYAKTASATGASLGDVAGVGVELKKKMGLTDQATAMGILAAQGKAGAIELKDLATQGPRIFATAAGGGYSGISGVTKIGGLAQLFAEGVGGSGAAARVATSIEGVFRDVNQKQKKFADIGVTVGKRDPVDVVKEVIEKFKGDDRAIAATKLFTAQSFRGVQTMSRAYRGEGVLIAGPGGGTTLTGVGTGGWGALDRFTGVKGEGLIDSDFIRAMRTGKSQLAITQARMDASFDRNLGNRVEEMAKKSGAAAGLYDFATANPGTMLAGGTAAIAARNTLKQLLGGGAGGGGAGALGGGVGGTPVRVFVTNPGFGGAPGSGGIPGMSPTTGGILKAGANMAQMVVPIAAMAVASQEMLGAVKLDKKGNTGFDIGLGYGGSFDAEKYRAVLDKANNEALTAAIEKSKAPVVNINIDKDGVSVEHETGTRSPTEKAKRGWR